MAEFLIKNFDSGHLNLTIDVTLEKVGDIVEVRPDGAVYGRKELLAEKFIIVRVPGLNYETSCYLMDALVDDTDQENPVFLKARRYTIKDALDLLDQYHVEGNIYEVPFHASWNSYIRDKGLV